ncbi:MAG: hypothetical protein JWM80_4264 [Cyanobacteria bacterium RYN_339]|nr:hypothetical protein [Cyanobacteria bacterium RYN_339]
MTLRTALSALLLTTLLAGCQSVALVRTVLHIHVPVETRLIVRVAPTDGYGLQYLQAMEWDAAEASLTGPGGTKTLTVNATVDAGTLARSAALHLDGLAPGAGYKLTVRLLSGGTEVAKTSVDALGLNAGGNLVSLSWNGQGHLAVPPPTTAIPGAGPTASNPGAFAPAVGVTWEDADGNPGTPKQLKVTFAQNGGQQRLGMLVARLPLATADFTATAQLGSGTTTETDGHFPDFVITNAGAGPADQQDVQLPIGLGGGTLSGASASYTGFVQDAFPYNLFRCQVFKTADSHYLVLTSLLDPDYDTSPDQSSSVTLAPGVVTLRRGTLLELELTSRGGERWNDFRAISP